MGLWCICRRCCCLSQPKRRRELCEILRGWAPASEDHCGGCCAASVCYCLIFIIRLRPTRHRSRMAVHAGTGFYILSCFLFMSLTGSEAVDKILSIYAYCLNSESLKRAASRR